ncbi:MAG: hypothetical protein A3F41_02895 [Coxiella sp. RIFCSPHIGHO2_12_FULL_44_14]|nr:MAG: hypothetical protein A3F41_02895 [Coxiella sp. RIFCSPHIGHO2_12_FULL_44_14]
MSKVSCSLGRGAAAAPLRTSEIFFGYREKKSMKSHVEDLNMLVNRAIASQAYAHMRPVIMK